MDCKETYETGLLYHHYANTAYPLTPRSFMQYKLTDTNEIRDFVCKQWEDADELSLYVHVPFCKSRCKFCEYVVLEGTDDKVEDEYVDLLCKEMKMYSEILKDKKIVGYDLGGGTPTKLSVKNLKRITQTLTELFNIAKDVVFSIETTPLIAANEPEKIKAVYDMGYKRISMGVQTVSEKLLSELGRDGSKSIYERAVENIRKAGFERFNIDLMYGFLYQNDVDFDNTLSYAVKLGPEYITLYRNRYKGTKLEGEAGGVSIYKAMHQYRIAYRVLTENGYNANIGKNTFSRIPSDPGTSDYLTKRVINGTSYVGMGLGAQSFGPDYLAYNMGAAEKKMERYRKAVNAGMLPFQDIYKLPQDESIAKMVSVSFYFAFVDMAAFEKRFHVDFRKKFEKEIDFVLENSLMEIRGDRIYLTERGADHINGVIPLFYSDRSKEELRTVFNRNALSSADDEKLFLSAYKASDYDRPSVATDIVLFSMMNAVDGDLKHSPEPRLKVLLIKRGEHPYMNHWALPGGFLKKDETVEECALREVSEETNVRPKTLFPIGVFSDPHRDVRTRVISNAFVSVVDADKYQTLGGDDAVDAEWFDISFNISDDGNAAINLSGSKDHMECLLEEHTDALGNTEFIIKDSGGIAFDHAKILATAFYVMRNQKDEYELVFRFLPEKFTLSSMQKTYEIINNIFEQPANFRRKVMNYVVETDEIEESVGHRPARLYKRNINK